MPRPSLYLTLLHRNLGEGLSWVEASDRALSGVAHAYDLVKQAVIGPPALRAGSSASASGSTPAPSRDESTESGDEAGDGAVGSPEAAAHGGAQDESRGA